MIVAKFGGTSMGNSQSIFATANIVKSINGKKTIVVSATSGTTDSLIKLGELALAGKSWKNNLQELIDKHQKIIIDLGINLDLSTFWSNIKNLLEGVTLIHELSLSAKDRLISTGERLSSKILATLLDKQGHHSEALDSYEFIFTDNNFGEGNVNFKKTNKAIQKKVGKLLEKNIIPIITGFIGQSEDSRYITLGRGGSDYSASIIGAALSCDEVQIWTDVDGIFNTDPRICKKAHVLDHVSFQEAAELAYFGAKVLHPKAIKPAIEKNIPVKILNTFNPSAKGTIITNHEVNSLKSVTAKKGIRIINICSAGMVDAYGFLARIFEIFARHKIVIDVISTSEVSVSLTIEKDLPKDLIKELEKFSTINILKNMAIVCLVGSGLSTNTRTIGKLFSNLEKYDINMISLGASKRNITFLVQENICTEVVNKVFHTFFTNK